MDVLLHETCAEESENVIGEMRVFVCSYELFKLATSSCICFVEHLTTRFYSVTTLTISIDEICCCRMTNGILLKD